MSSLSEHNSVQRGDLQGRRHKWKDELAQTDSVEGHPRAVQKWFRSSTKSCSNLFFQDPHDMGLGKQKGCATKKKRQRIQPLLETFING